MIQVENINALECLMLYLSGLLIRCCVLKKLSYVQP